MTGQTANQGRQTPDSFEVRILRQDGPGQPGYWETFRVGYETDMNVISVLQRIAARPRTVDGKNVAPAAWECNCLEEVCGACTMVINGRVRQACSALVDPLLADHPSGIELRPMTKFPVIRDLVVDRSRLFHSLLKLKIWLPVDGYYNAGPGPLQRRSNQEEAYSLSKCMTCGCCVDACPQYGKIELARRRGESAQQFQQRNMEAYDRGFVGAHAISQVLLYNEHPTGAESAGERLDALMAKGGIQVCGNAQNCVRVCPKEIPLTSAIARAGRATTQRALQRWFDM